MSKPEKTSSANKIPVKKVYYGHNKSIYGTEKEHHELRYLKRKFVGYEIINPADYEEEWQLLTEKERMARCYALIRSSVYFIFTENLQLQ